MSQNSLKNAKLAQKNKSLLGSTNQSTSQKTPKTASKVEKSAVQAGTMDPKDIKGNVVNSTKE